MKRPLCLFAAATLLFAVSVTAQSRNNRGGAAVEFQQYDGSYFERNDSGLTGEKSFLVLTDQGQFDRIFGAAATMGRNDFLPPDTFATKIIVATIKRGGFREYSDVKVTAKGRDLLVSYNAKDSEPGSATYSTPLILSVSKGKYRSVVFVENGKRVGTVKLGRKV